MPAPKTTQQNPAAGSTTVPTAGGNQATSAPPGIAPTKSASQLENLLVLADTVNVDKGDLYIAVHRVIRPGLQEGVRYSLYSCQKEEPSGMRWSVKGSGPDVSTNHAPVRPQEVETFQTRSLRLCFAVVLKQDISSQIRRSSSSTAALGKNIPKSDWERVAQVIAQGDNELQSVANSLDYVRLAVGRLKRAGLVKFRDEPRFWEEVERAEKIFASGNVGPLPDRILMSRHILYC